MVIIPLVVGVVLAGAQPIHIPLAVAWLSGYFAFFAAGLWLKAAPRRRRTYLAPLGTYGAISGIATLLVVAWQPAVLRAAVAYVPLIAIAVWEAYHKRPRSILSGEATTLASAALVPVCAMAVRAPINWTATILLALNFCGTIFYIKTLIRQRGSRSYYLGSIAYHAAALCAAVALTHNQEPSWVAWGSAAVFAVLLARAIIAPLPAFRGQPTMSPKQAGRMEAAFTVAVVVLAIGSGLA